MYAHTPATPAALTEGWERFQMVLRLLSLTTTNRERMGKRTKRVKCLLWARGNWNSVRHCKDPYIHSQLVFICIHGTLRRILRARESYWKITELRDFEEHFSIPASHHLASASIHKKPHHTRAATITIILHYPSEIWEGALFKKGSSLALVKSAALKKSSQARLHSQWASL